MTSLDLARRFAACFEAAKELQKTQSSEVAALFEAVAAHLRSAAPLALLGPSSMLEPLTEARIPLADGALVELTVTERGVLMYVQDASGHDVAVPVPAVPAEEIRAALARVR